MVNKCVNVTYPIIGDFSKLKDNRYQVVGMGTDKRRS